MKVKVQKLARRLKITRRIVAAALCGSVLATAASLWVSSRKGASASAPPVALPENVEQQLSGFNFTRSEGGRTLFTIRSEKTVSFSDGAATVLENVTAEVFGRSGERRDIFRTARGEYDTSSGDFFAPGWVRIELDPPASPPAPSTDSGNSSHRNRLKVETSQLRFSQKSSTAKSGEEVRFEYGQVRGRGRGLEYDSEKEFVRVKEDVRLILEPPKGSDAPSIHLEAAHLDFENGKGLIRLTPAVLGSRGKQRLSARETLLKLDRQGRVREMVMEGPVKFQERADDYSLAFQADRLTARFDAETQRLVSMVADRVGNARLEQGGRISRFEARKLNVRFHPARSEVLEAVAEGGAELRSVLLAEPVSSAPHTGVAGVPGGVPGEAKLLQADRMRFTFRPAGGSLQQLSAEGNSRLEWAGDGPEESRKWVSAHTLAANFDAENRLERIEATPRARLVMDPGPRGRSRGRLPKRTESDRLLALFDTSTGTLDRVQQMGNFRYSEGDRRARAERADYVEATGDITLQGKPVFWDPASKLSADEIRINETTGTMEATGAVRGTHHRPRSEGFFSRRSPASSAPPINVMADRAGVGNGRRSVRYEGRVRTWRGQDVITSSFLEVFRGQKRVQAGGGVSTSYLRPGEEEASGSGTPVTISADSLDYRDGEGRDEEGTVTYQGNVLLLTEHTRVEADRLVVRLARNEEGEPARIEHATGEGQVKLRQPGRRAEGRRLEYFPRTGKIVLQGGPPVAYDAERGMTTGERLTFSVADDSIGVHGGEDSRTYTRHRVER
ncbi:MAG: hypothetical protein O6850_01480 [Acidobacteria bacterium]|nr:hypothetical protein [Acidobacteriota bacterium]